ncbi:MAG TPA: hypothetical protein VJ180_01235 [Pyrinomonadaceae bacterium]|nr:hypothetical protein [Pyrinomonadaceae bacterium]
MFRDDPGQIRSFVKIAIDAGKGKIVDLIATAVNFGNDVLDAERSERRIILMQNDNTRKRFEHAREPEP